ncbi:hypothetical protein [Shinella sp. BYT-45]|uniref:hypothetical protein n=1 Tax=Shinella sp. BYT-45 TaxID=3377377 RepID=UPI00397FA1EA
MNRDFITFKLVRSGNNRVAPFHRSRAAERQLELEMCTGGGMRHRLPVRRHQMQLSDRGRQVFDVSDTQAEGFLGKHGTSPVHGD